MAVFHDGVGGVVALAIGCDAPAVAPLDGAGRFGAVGLFKHVPRNAGQTGEAGVGHGIPGGNQLLHRHIFFGGKLFQGVVPLFIVGQAGAVVVEAVDFRLAVHRPGILGHTAFGVGLDVGGV